MSAKKVVGEKGVQRQKEVERQIYDLINGEWENN